jgi:opacity protein-like surface antigen
MAVAGKRQVAGFHPVGPNRHGLAALTLSFLRGVTRYSANGTLFLMLIRAIIVFVVAAGSAQADGLTSVAPAPVRDWSGSFAGLSYGTAGGDMTFFSVLPSDLTSGSIGGVHAGYLFQRGSLVYGGEVAYGKVNGSVVEIFDGNDEIDNVLDLKGRLGFATNRALVYGVLAYSWADYLQGGGGDDYKVDGIGFGLGAEYAVSDRVSVGLEYLSRDLPGSGSDAEVVTDARFETLSLRVGLSF